MLIKYAKPIDANEIKLTLKRNPVEFNKVLFASLQEKENERERDREKVREKETEIVKETQWLNEFYNMNYANTTNITALRYCIFPLWMYSDGFDDVSLVFFFSFFVIGWRFKGKSLYAWLFPFLIAVVSRSWWFWCKVYALKIQVHVSCSFRILSSADPCRILINMQMHCNIWWCCTFEMKFIRITINLIFCV